MDETSRNQASRGVNPGPRPFVSGRPSSRPEAVSPSALPRPFPVRQSVTVAAPQSRTPGWNVAVYEPGLELEAQAPALDASPEPLDLPAASVEDDMAEASLALADAVHDAERHANSVAAANVMDSVAHRLRIGEILLPAGAPPRQEAAVVAAVLAALLGERH